MFVLRYFGVSPVILHMFYCSFIESVLTFCLIYWFGTLSMKNRGMLNGVVYKGSKVVGVRQTGLNQLCESRAKRKGIHIMSIGYF